MCGKYIFLFFLTGKTCDIIIINLLININERGVNEMCL